MVVELNPLGNRAACLLQGLEPMAVRALRFPRADHSFDHTVLLTAMRRDELLSQTVASNKRRNE